MCQADREGGPSRVLLVGQSPITDALVRKMRTHPEYGLEHVRDFLRFKCVACTVTEAFVFLEMLVDKFEVVKFDIDKFVEPKEWGW